MTSHISHMISHNPYGQSQEQFHVPLQFTMLEVPLSDEQVKVYDTAAHVWCVHMTVTLRLFSCYTCVSPPGMSSISLSPLL